ncbi:serine carboxypeptidase S28 [Capsaspora owczarzaki ATCC 30864]|uniref:Serine carboxypeptidase S28 n=1 Tax=Capsaspora owczarzaki (strain ATCC 30864) TaxID=595528 RepID=A0A0D2WWS7_CAPO3|nr:serine carboxypeptidase S28 [Capsaspora owczarzaki ATCC 30864]KJE97480.1 serine carboxypeptidase S28 [Capsaspora owczarzaki ATCC 30864]|eukprot:XP_004343190.1 serine carboxypeptidase S28 [Capsaspora owczarzaki ATCC 30864]
MVFHCRAAAAAASLGLAVLLVACLAPDAATALGRTPASLIQRRSASALGNDSQSVFNQLIDHFNPQHRETFKQRYFENTDNFDPVNGPIFLYICGEATCGGIPNDYIRVLSKQFNAAIVTLEHRYYGESSPFAQLTTPNLQYLTSRQAINDLAAFRDFYQHNVVDVRYAQQRAGRGDNLWFTYGVSYSGALSAWFRLKFPHLTAGSLASSGVVDVVLSFPEFDEQVTRSVGSDCANALHAAMSGVEALLAANPVATKVLFKATSLSSNLDFLSMLADSTALSVQYGHKDSMCPPLVQAFQAGQNMTLAFAQYVTTSFYTIFEVDPFSYSQEYLKQVQAGPDSGARQWTYQTCAEMGYFQVAPAGFSIRSRQLTIDYYQSLCQNVFGVWPPVINATNEYYGARNIASTQTFFTNGAQDPWQNVTLQVSNNPLRPTATAVCDNCGHGVDMRGCPQSPAQTNGDTSLCKPDGSNVKAIQASIVQYLQAWLKPQL